MSLTPTREIIDAAHDNGTGAGAFNVIHLETAEALVAGAESAGRGVILQISQNCAAYHGSLAPLGLACLTFASAATVPVAVHLDHAEDEALAREAVDLGFGSVMYDGATLPYAQNVAATKRVVQYCARARRLRGGRARRHRRQGRRPRPGRAHRSCRGGELRGRHRRGRAGGGRRVVARDDAAGGHPRPRVIARLRAALAVPLVLHGSSGVSDDRAGRGDPRRHDEDQRVDAPEPGVHARTAEYLAAEPTVVDSRKYVRAGRYAVAGEAARLLTLFSVNDREKQTGR